MEEDLLAKTAALYEAGDVIAGKYQLEALLGQGGMGAVFRARNLALDAPVAIKVVQRSSDRPLLRGRLLQEARAAAKLSHPHIVKVFDVGETAEGEPFIVMELLVGRGLGALLEQEQRLSSIQAVRLLLPIVDALWLAHDKGMVHRDLKPDNVFIVEHESGIEPKLLDFGIVKLDARHGDTHLTEGGATVGSPDYMSPEQARGQDDIDLLSDVWSLSVVLYETISGQTPFTGGNYNALMHQIVEHTPPTLLALAAADAELSAIVERGMRKQPAERFSSMGELGRALARWLLAQGVTEDITGTTLEARWLRADARVRGGRGSLPSIHDTWPAEAGSGVRPASSAASSPLPTPPDTTFLEAFAGDARGRKPRRWVGVAGLALLLALSGLALVVARGRGTPQAASVPTPPLPSADPAVSSSAPAPAPLAEPEPDPAPSDASPRAPASARIGLSSAPRRAVGAPPRAPAPQSPSSATKPPRSRPAPQPDDLLSPYP